MKVKMILPALTEAKSPFWRPIKYSLFPPLGLGHPGQAGLSSTADAGDNSGRFWASSQRPRTADRRPGCVACSVQLTPRNTQYEFWK